MSQHTTRESVIGGLYLMWSGNPHLRLGELMHHYLAIEGTTLEEASDLIWPQREWKFCPFCGSNDPAACMNPNDPTSCIAQMWDDDETDEQDLSDATEN